MASTAPADGRLARSWRTRQALLDAVLERFVAGEARPSAPSIAAAAGVSLRTVWQHFDDLGALWAEAARRETERALAHRQPIDASAPLVERVDSLVAQRVATYEEMAPVWRAGRQHDRDVPEVRDGKAELLAVGRAQLAEVFPAELAGADPAVATAVEVASMWATWEALRVDLGLPLDAARAAMVTLLRAALEGARAPVPTR